MPIIDLTEEDEMKNMDYEMMEEVEEDEEDEFVPWKEEDIPDEFKCPISLEIMMDPVLLNDGFYYDRECIIDWLNQHNRSPMTNLSLEQPSIRPDHHLRGKIQEWIEEQWEKYHNQLDKDQDDDIMDEQSQFNINRDELETNEINEAHLADSKSPSSVNSNIHSSTNSNPKQSGSNYNSNNYTKLNHHFTF